MEFRNLTPFSSLAFEAVDAKDREYHVVALSVGYALRRLPSELQAENARSGQGWLPTHELVLLDAAPDILPLCLADTHWGDPATTSMVRESDLAPYKPRCDVTVVGSAFAAQPAPRFEARLRVDQDDHTLIDKKLALTGPRAFVRDGSVMGAVFGVFDETSAYALSSPLPCAEVPLRYEHAFGGRSEIASPASASTTRMRVGDPAAPGYLINEVCLRNPVGAGWVAQGYLRALARTPAGLPKLLPAPRISLGGSIEQMTCGRPVGALTPAQMAKVRYPHEVAGFSAIGKAWAPRLELAGTADETWQRERAPNLPTDFDFGFWNGAPRDQQIPFPDLSRGVRLLAAGLLPAGAPMRVQIPNHRAYTLMRLEGGLVLPNPMCIDLIELDNQDPDQVRLRLVFRTAVLKAAQPRVLEARFEADPSRPLFQLEPSAGYEQPELQAMQRQLEQEH